LPVSVKQKIEETELVFVSAVSIWEIAIKINIGKLSTGQKVAKVGRKGFYKR